MHLMPEEHKSLAEAVYTCIKENRFKVRLMTGLCFVKGRNRSMISEVFKSRISRFTTRDDYAIMSMVEHRIGEEHE